MELPFLTKNGVATYLHEYLYTELHCFLGLVLRGEKNNYSVFNGGSVPPIPLPLRSRRLSTPPTPHRLFFAPLRNDRVSKVISGHIRDVLS
jgi:hypothetical protein